MKVLGAVLIFALLLAAYPLDSAKRTGIRRLAGYQLAQEGKVQGPRIPPGGLWGEARIQLRLMNNRDFDIKPDTPRDAALQAKLESILGGRNQSYGIALLDISDPAHPRYAAVRETDKLLPGSVGKLCIATGFMGALRKTYPDPAAREKFLRSTIRTADAFVNVDGKTVPFYEDGWPAVVNRRINIGDKFSLWEWLDHMLSVSSNAAGSFTWKQAILLRHFGTQLSGTGGGREGILRYDLEAGPRAGVTRNVGRAFAKFRHRYGELASRNDVHERWLASDSGDRQLCHSARAASLAGASGARKISRRMVEP